MKRKERRTKSESLVMWVKCKRQTTRGKKYDTKSSPPKLFYTLLNT